MLLLLVFSIISTDETLSILISFATFISVVSSVGDDDSNLRLTPLLCEGGVSESNAVDG
jgi:hypothetical protein